MIAYLIKENLWGYYGSFEKLYYYSSRINCEMLKSLGSRTNNQYIERSIMLFVRRMLAV